MQSASIPPAAGRWEGAGCEAQPASLMRSQRGLAERGRAVVCGAWTAACAAGSATGCGQCDAREASLVTDGVRIVLGVGLARHLCGSGRLPCAIR